MTRLEKRYKLLGSDCCPSHPSILDVCLGLHMQITGVSDEKVEPKFIDFLLMCLKTWEEGSTRNIGFDNSVRQLIVEVLTEASRDKHMNTNQRARWHRGIRGGDA